MILNHMHGTALPRVENKLKYLPRLSIDREDIFPGTNFLTTIPE